MTLPILAGQRCDGSVDPDVAHQVARAWLSGGLVGLPTETVYGLSADAQNEHAVARVYRAKGRPADHPLIVHVAGPEAIAGWSDRPNSVADVLAKAFWPGALTVVVSRGERAGDFVTGGQQTVALRCPDHELALACLHRLTQESADPARGVAAPSANRFGRVSPTRASDVLVEVGAHLDPDTDLVVDGGPCRIGVESTIVDCTTTEPRVLRLGAISQQRVEAVLAGRPGMSAAPRRPAGVVAGGRVRAPGTLESHYAPHARVFLVEAADLESRAPGLGGQEGALRAVAPSGAGSVGLLGAAPVTTPPGWTRLLASASELAYAHQLYAALRRADELGLNVVVAVLPDARDGALAAAVRDRLARAAHRG